MIGVVVVRDGRLGDGSGEVAAVAEEVWLLGDGLDRLASAPRATTRAVELGPYAPGAWSRWLADQVGGRSVVLAAEPDGRDLAGRLAELLARPVYAECLELRVGRAVSPRHGSATTCVAGLEGAVVATVAVGRAPDDGHPVPPIERAGLVTTGEPRTLAIEEPDASSRGLSGAALVLGGGAGLSGPDDLARLGRVAAALGGAMGATRVVADRGWAPNSRQIGTTGVAVDPESYVAFGVSGAVQHTAGLGTPSLVVSVNLDPGCPMSQMADLALVADAPATLEALERRIGEGS